MFCLGCSSYGRCSVYVDSVERELAQPAQEFEDVCMYAYG